MKEIKKYLGVILLAVFSIAIYAGSEKIISFDQLPEPAQELIKTNFANKKIFKVESELESSGLEYEVKFTDRSEIKFNAKGDWKEISDEVSGVPAKLVPQKILRHVKDNYGETSIVSSIKKKAYGFKVEINDKIDLLFDKGFNFLGKD